jgi:hypothetical protein
MVADSISQAALLAVQLGIPLGEVQKQLASKYDNILSQRNSQDNKKETT